VKGWKTRLNKKPETKFTTYLSPDTPAMPNWNTGILAIWSTNQPDGAGNLRFTWPTNGNGGNQFEGTKWNGLYIELVFDFKITATPANISLSSANDTFRLIMVRPRDRNIGPPVAANLLTANGPIFPVNSKLWDIHLDRTYQFTTGLTSTRTTGFIRAPVNPSPDNAVDEVTTGVTTIGPRSKRFRMIIPMKHTFSVVAPNAADVLPYPIYLLGYMRTNNAIWSIVDLCSTFYFRDP